MPRVSVIIPVYNADQYLRQCLESVTGQSFPDIEVICVDDGSTDGSFEILKRAASEDDRITVHTIENQGVSAARNVGFGIANGDYVLFFDADDYLDPTMIEDVLARCEADDAQIGIFKARYVYEKQGSSEVAHGSLRMDLMPEKRPFNRSDISGNILSAVTPAVWNKLFQREFLLEEGIRFAAELRRAEDVPFTYLALMKAKRITAIDRPLVNYRKEVGGSLRATINEDPTAICRALELTRNGLEEAGLLNEAEHEFVNTALYQCLFTLEELGSLTAFCGLYEALKTTYFDTLGISNHPRTVFANPEHYDRYLTIQESSCGAYLFAETRALRGRLKETRRQSIRTAPVMQAYEEQPDYIFEPAVHLIEESQSLKGQLEEAELKLTAMKAARTESKADVDALSNSWLYQLTRRLKSLRGESRTKR